MPAKPLVRAGQIYGMIYDVREVEIELKEHLGPKAFHIPMSTYVGAMVRHMGYPLREDTFTGHDRYVSDEYLSCLRRTDIGAYLLQRHCNEVFEIMHRFNQDTGYNGQDFVLGMTVLRDAVTVTYRLED